MEYTEEVHACRLISMINAYSTKEIGMYCPGRENFDTGAIVMLDGEPHGGPVCTLCKTFVGAPLNGYCPCYAWPTKKKALEKTVAALKKKGYL